MRFVCSRQRERDFWPARNHRPRQAARDQPWCCREIGCAAELVRNSAVLRRAFQMFRRVQRDFQNEETASPGDRAKSVRSFCQCTKSLAMLGHNFAAQLKLLFERRIVWSKKITFGCFDREESVAAFDF